AGFGLALPGSFILMGTSVSVCLSLQQLMGAGDRISPSLHDHVILLLCQAPLLIAWSWTGGFVVGSLSRRTLWLSVALCAAACLVCLSSFRMPSLSRLSLLVFLLPAIAGLCQGVRKKQIAPGFAIPVAATITVLMATLQSVSGWSAGLLVLLWPAWYMVATA
ncbi:MAG TPA: hypothetical protein VLL04_06450, partial [Rhizomicrobium sp.]|nr:hypothetical protein [Rhizomicrobium sp.]